MYTYVTKWLSVDAIQLSGRNPIPPYWQTSDSLSNALVTVEPLKMDILNN